ncbi:arylsulfatase D-like isoform X2 [Crassostrea virginica]
MKKVVFLLLCLYGNHLASNIRHHKQNLPELNVLLMIADDLRIGDVSCYGNRNVRTPNIDLLASEGMKFNRMYSFPSDSGAMAAILEGQQPRKFGLVKSSNRTWSDFWSPAQEGGLLPGSRNLGRVFSVNQMSSFYNGKWALGSQPDTIPTSAGFSSFFAPFKNRTESALYDSIAELDWSVGKVLKSLEENELKNNTLVIFVSDNAPSFIHPVTKQPLSSRYHESNMFTTKGIVKKLRGEKGSNMEGGLRVPAIMRLPGTIPPNTETSVVTSLMDIYPTILDYYKFEKTAHDRTIDGKSLYPVFMDPSLAPSSSLHDQLYHYCDLGPVGAVTVGNLKILFRNGTETDCTGPLLDNPLIYNISSDPEELHPLPLSEHMPLLYHLKASLRKYEMKANLNQVKRSQYDKFPNPFDFPCWNILDCTKTYDEYETFNALFDE